MTRTERVLAIDPGKLSGVALLERRDDEVKILFTAELDENQIIPALRPHVERWKPRHEGDYPLRVVIEKFTITLETAKKSQAPFSLEVIGAVKQMCRDYEYPIDAIAWQKPVEAKEPLPNPKLKRLGLWHKGGAGHALDALRHAAVYLIRSGWSDGRMVLAEVTSEEQPKPPAMPPGDDPRAGHPIKPLFGKASLPESR